MRKPNKMYFNIVKAPLLKTYMSINSTDIWYIGNDYHFDVHGSNISGLTPVWINRHNDDNPLDINCINVSNYIELCDYIRGLLDD